MPIDTKTLSLTNPTSAPIPWATFPWFMQLPPEARLHIWSYFHKNNPPTCAYCSIMILQQIRSKADMKKVPSMLHACQESREFGLCHYSLGFNFSSHIEMNNAKVLYKKKKKKSENTPREFQWAAALISLSSAPGRWLEQTRGYYGLAERDLASTGLSFWGIPMEFRAEKRKALFPPT